MVTSPKGLAALTSGLLARKGEARPAMRSQNFGNTAPSPAALDDLGWNDMGVQPAPVRPVDPTVAPVDAAAALPEVLVARAALATEIAAPVADAPNISDTPSDDNVPPIAVASVSLATAARLRRETAHAGSAAFTLRLHAARHLRLRLASAVTNRSAQSLVAQALDHFLSTLPEVETLVAQLPPVKSRAK